MLKLWSSGRAGGELGARQYLSKFNLLLRQTVGAVKATHRVEETSAELASRVFSGQSYLPTLAGFRDLTQP